MIFMTERMIFMTERQHADSEVDRLKSLIKQTYLNYELRESPFSISIKLRKNFVSDWSKTSKLTTSTPTHPTKPLSPTVLSFSHNLDSGFASNSEFSEKHLGELNDLKEKLAEKDSLIETLEKRTQNAEASEKQLKEQIESAEEEKKIMLTNANKLVEILKDDLSKKKRGTEQTKRERVNQE